MRYPILVAYDGSDGAGAALRWALAEGVRRALPVHVVTVLQIPVVPVAGWTALSDAPPLIVEAESVLDKVVFEAAATAPEVEVTGQAVVGPVTGTLCDLSQRASMVVLGGRGLGGFAALLVGSVSVTVTAHAHCPVVVVREDARALAGAPVVLGVDESPQARLAAWFAYEEAATRGVELVAVHATEAPVPSGAAAVWTPALGDADVAALSVLGEVLDSARRRYPGVGLHTRLMAGTPGQVLSVLSRQAQLLVVGSRGRGGFHGLLLGSVSHQVLHHAHCPVAVVRDSPSIVEDVRVPRRVA